MKNILGQFIILTDIIDVYNRKLVGKEITKTETINDVLVAVQRALKENNVTTNIVLRSDNDPQFTLMLFWLKYLI